MAKLVIDNVFISFLYKDSSYNAEITRLILEDKIIFNVNYCVENDPVPNQCQLSFSVSDDGRKLIWKEHTPGITREFAELVGKEIEKLPLLFDTTDFTPAKTLNA